jgi:hypothetical protein
MSVASILRLRHSIPPLMELLKELDEKAEKLDSISEVETNLTAEYLEEVYDNILDCLPLEFMTVE